MRTLVETGGLVGERGAYRLGQPLDTWQVPATVQALAALEHLPGSRAATEQAIDLRLGLRAALNALGEAPGRMLDHLRRAESLAQTLGDQLRLGRVYVGMGGNCWRAGEVDHAIVYGQQALGLAYAQQGRVAAGLALVEQEMERQVARGRPRALALLIAGLARRIGWLAAIRVDKFRRERHAIRDRSDALVALSTDQGFLLREAAGMIEQGWMLVDRGQGAEEIKYMQEGLARSQATGSALAKAYPLGLLAEAYGKVGQAEAGLQVLADAGRGIACQSRQALARRATGMYVRPLESLWQPSRRVSPTSDLTTMVQ